MRARDLKDRLRWANVSLRYKGLIVVGIPMLPLVVTAFLWYSNQRRADAADGLVAHTLKVKAELSHTLTLLVDAELGARGYLLTHDPEMVRAFHAATAALVPTLRQLVQEVRDDSSQIVRLRKMGPLARNRPLSSIIAYADKMPAGSPPPLDLLERSRTSMKGLRDVLQEMQEAEDALLVTRSDEAHAARRQGTRVTIGGLVVGLAGGVFAMLLFTRSVARRVGDVASNAKRLARGEALLPMEASRDEVGGLADALDRAGALLAERDAELRRRVEQTAAANRELESFSYSVSHDLRAPLRHIDGFASLLERRADGLDEQGRKHLRTIREAATRMGQLVDDLLSFSRMGRAEMACADVDLHTLVSDVVEEVRRDEPTRAIEWTIDPLPPVYGDRAMLRVAFRNLLANAAKYTGPVAHPAVTVGTLPRVNGEQIVYVRDNGVGFNMTYAHKLFGVFQRLHAADEFEGTGIGLANVHRIVQRHGGRTWAEGAVNQGATFFIALPDHGEAGS
ncbi:MAG: hypothetical protein DMF85_20890 [Acidobacteria bacterium]|nr:MAG: hypothetical protein DMF85_20890 [Acidobacteriota bacterium]